MSNHMVVRWKLCNLTTEIELWFLLFYYVVENVPSIGIDLVSLRHKVSGISEHNIDIYKKWNNIDSSVLN